MDVSSINVMTCHFNCPLKATNLGFLFGLGSERLIDRIAGLSDQIALRRPPILRDDPALLRRAKSNVNAGKYIGVKSRSWRSRSRPLARRLPYALAYAIS